MEGVRVMGLSNALLGEISFKDERGRARRAADQGSAEHLKNPVAVV
jgi:hypothetical protein